VAVTQAFGVVFSRTDIRDTTGWWFWQENAVNLVDFMAHEEHYWLR